MSQFFRSAIAAGALSCALLMSSAQAQSPLAANVANAEIPTAASRAADEGEPLPPIPRDYSLFWFVVPIAVILSLGISAHRDRKKDSNEPQSTGGEPHGRAAS